MTYNGLGPADLGRHEYTIFVIDAEDTYFSRGGNASHAKKPFLRETSFVFSSLFVSNNCANPHFVPV